MGQANGVRIVKGFGRILLAASLVTTLSVRAGHDQPTEDLVYFLPIAAERAKQLLDSGEKLVFIDLREPAEFAARRLPGGRSIPLKELPQRLEEVPKTGRVVLYCACPPGQVEEGYAYQLLRDRGYRNVGVLTEGFRLGAARLSGRDGQAMKRRHRSMYISLLVLLGMLIPCAPAWGHAYLIKSSPAKRAVLLAAPARLQLWFNERLEPRFCSLTLSDERGQPTALAKLQIDAADPKRLSVTVPRLTPGIYTVKFRVVSVDGHVVEDQFIFTLRGPDTSR